MTCKECGGTQERQGFVRTGQCSGGSVEGYTCTNEFHKPYRYEDRKKVSPVKTLNDYAKESHQANIKWWQNVLTGESITRNFGELIALCHSELSEALEGNRKNLMDDKLPHRRMDEVELADCLIRVFDLAGALGMDLEGAYNEKTAYNAQREDHKHEQRLKAGGKAY